MVYYLFAIQPHQQHHQNNSLQLPNLIFNFYQTMIRSIVSQLPFKMPLRLYQLSAIKGLPFMHFITVRNLQAMHLNYRPCFTFATASQQAEESAPQEFKAFVSDPVIIRNLAQNGLTKMFPIQSSSFQDVLDGKDLLASDRTGSGKTLAYTLPILQKFFRAGNNPLQIKKPKFLILSPTRQLALQVTNQLKKFASNYKVVCVYGGSSISDQIRSIENGVAIVVATPGRLIDLIDREAVDLSDLQAVCLDEADTMLEKGFKMEVERIMEEVTEAAGKTQNLMFSATIPPWVAKIASRYLKNMTKINLIREEQVRTSQTVEHYALMVKEQERYEAVLQLIQRFNPENRTIIFTQTKAEANEFIRYFEKDEIVILHGDISQGMREVNLRKFRDGVQKILIATDVAARGLDIPNIDLVIQLSPPENPEPYIHRSGRTGRAGKEGINITFFDESNIEDLIQIENQANIQIKIINNNFNIDIWKKQADKLLEEIAQNEAETDDPFYQLFVDQILKRCKPEQALLYLLKHRLGKVPQMTSAITNHKGYITYIAYKSEPSAPSIQQTFKGIKIFNLTESESDVKFDILWNDYYHFEQIINQQNHYELQIYDENNTFTLKKYYQNLRKKGKFNVQRGYGSRQRDQRESRQPRYSGQYRVSRSQNYNRPPRQNINQPTNKIFISRIPDDVTKEELEDEIKLQTGVNDFQIKKITKTDPNGELYSFGFIELTNSEDSLAILNKKVTIQGTRLNLKPSESK